MSQDKISEIRRNIDLADKRIIDSLSLRFELTERLAKYKDSDKIYDTKREKQIISNIIKYAMPAKLNSDFIQNLYKQILSESKKQLKNILQK